MRVSRADGLGVLVRRWRLGEALHLLPLSGGSVRLADADASIPSISSACDRWRELGKLMPERLLVSETITLRALKASP